MRTFRITGMILGAQRKPVVGKIVCEVGIASDGDRL
jgi:hypothetical protein